MEYLCLATVHQCASEPSGQSTRFRVAAEAMSKREQAVHKNKKSVQGDRREYEGDGALPLHPALSLKKVEGWVRNGRASEASGLGLKGS